MTEDELIELGMQAETMLASEMFTSFYALAQRRFGEQFLALPFERRNELNDLHLAKCGMDFFSRQLVQLKQAKDEIVTKRDYENSLASNPDFE